MIVEALVTMVAGLVEFLGGLFGTFEMPTWWGSVDGWLNSLAEAASGYGQWVPFGLAVQVAAFVFSSLGIAFVIKLVRIVASFFLAGGGSAA